MLDGCECDHLVVMGDFNVDMFASGHQKRHLEEFMASFNLRNTVTSATRSTERSRSCIDLVLINSDAHKETCVMECPFFDHDLVVSTFGISTESSWRIKSKVVARRDFKNFSVDQFQQLLLNSDITSFERL